MARPWTLRLGALAVGFETCAVLAVFWPEPVIAVCGTVVLHLLAVLCCSASAYRRCGEWATENHAVSVTALFVPLFGPCLAWMFPLAKDPDAEVNAHAYFERFEDIAQGASVAMGCLPEDGTIEAKMVNPMSFAEILRHGSVAHRRNALTKLAELGQPRHLRMLRSVMATEPGELRLCAFLELRRVARPFEDRIAEIQAELDAGADPEVETDLRVELVEQRLGILESGALDAEMERFHAERADLEIEPIWQTQKYDPRTSKARSRACLRRGRLAQALDGLKFLHEREQVKPEVRLIRAEIGYRMRDFEITKRESDALAPDFELPDWLAVLHPRPEEADAGSGEPEEAAECPPTDADDVGKPDTVAELTGGVDT